MNAQEAGMLVDAMVERYPNAPTWGSMRGAWTAALADDDQAEMAVALASWYGRNPQKPPTIADLRNEPRVTMPAGSRIMQLARAAYESECARLGKQPRMDLFRGAAEVPLPEGDYTPGRVDEVGATGPGHVPFPTGGPPSSEAES